MCCSFGRKGRLACLDFAQKSQGGKIEDIRLEQMVEIFFYFRKWHMSSAYINRTKTYD